jgi:hypothetical protein
MAWYGKTTSISRHCFEWAFKGDEEPRPTTRPIASSVRLRIAMLIGAGAPMPIGTLSY